MRIAYLGSKLVWFARAVGREFIGKERVTVRYVLRCRFREKQGLNDEVMTVKAGASLLTVTANLLSPSSRIRLLDPIGCRSPPVEVTPVEAALSGPVLTAVKL